MIFTEIFILFKFFYVVNFLIFNFQNLINKLIKINSNENIILKFLI